MRDETLRRVNGARVPVGILGATGAVGQKFIELLSGHPWFDIRALAASDRSAGQRYGDVVQWQSAAPLPPEVAGIVVEETKPGLDCAIVFSALPTSEASLVEPAFAKAGYVVISNASSYRMAPDVPLIIPEVNPDHVGLIERQASYSDGGYIVTNPNCSTTGLVATLKPIHDRFGLRAVQVTTLQALSGAGYPGVPSLDAVGNVVPFIKNEEEKIAEEPRKLLGRLISGGIVEADIPVSAQCTRVPVVDGHMLCVSVSLERTADPEAVAETLAAYQGPEEVRNLPSAPERFLQVLADVDAPQPRKHVGAGGGMTTTIGRIQRCAVNDIKYVALVHNTVRGAAGGAILNAELLVAKGLVSPHSVGIEDTSSHRS